MMQTSRPNIVLVLADDMGYGDVGCYGAEKIPTPHMDRLAARGVRFTDAHSSSSVCTPSRYSVLTGRYCWRSRLHMGVLSGHSPPLIEPGRPTIASFLQDQGYRTACVGKWHLGLGWQDGDGNPLAQSSADPDSQWWKGRAADYARGFDGGPIELGFDYYFGMPASLDIPPYCYLEGRHCAGIPSLRKTQFYPGQQEGFIAENFHEEEVDVTFTRKAVNFLEGRAETESESPFFLYLATSAPHRPCAPPGFIRNRSTAGKRGDLVCLVDWAVGEIADTLERLGVLDNTLFIVTSDNGALPGDVDHVTHGHHSCGPWRGTKADIWEGGHRIPLIAAWPGHVPPGQVRSEPVCLTDLFSTLAGLLQAPLPPESAEDSFDISPLLTQSRPSAPPRSSVIHHSYDGMFALRRETWKLIEGLGSGGFTPPRRDTPQNDGPEGQLYELGRDPHEDDNLWLRHPGIVRDLQEDLNRQRTRPATRPRTAPETTEKK